MSTDQEAVLRGWKVTVRVINGPKMELRDNTLSILLHMLRSMASFSFTLPPLQQWRESGCNSGDAVAHPEGLVGARGRVWGVVSRPHRDWENLYFLLEMVCFSEF